MNNQLTCETLTIKVNTNESKSISDRDLEKSSNDLFVNKQTNLDADLNEDKKENSSEELLDIKTELLDWL